MAEFGTAITHLRDVLGEATYESLARKGETMTTAAMVTYAIRPNRPCPSRTRTPWLSCARRVANAGVAQHTVARLTPSVWANVPADSPPRCIRWAKAAFGFPVKLEGGMFQCHIANSNKPR